MSDCTCITPGLCGACTPGHTEGKALDGLRAEWAGRETSDVATALAAELARAETYSAAGMLPKKKRANERADLLLRLVNDRRGMDATHRDVSRRGSARLGKHTPTPRQMDRPQFDPNRRK